MKFVFIVLAALAALAAAQHTDDLPPCAKPCIEQLLKTKVGNCDAGNVQCICSNKESIQSVKVCLEKEKCSQDDMNATLKHAYGMCLKYSVTIPTNMQTTPPTSTSGTHTGTVTHTGTGTITTTATYKPGPPNSTTTTPTKVATSTSTGAAATGYVINGLGVAGAAAAFFFL